MLLCIFQYRTHRNYNYINNWTKFSQYRILSLKKSSKIIVLILVGLAKSFVEKDFR